MPDSSLNAAAKLFKYFALVMIFLHLFIINHRVNMMRGLFWIHARHRKILYTTKAPIYEICPCLLTFFPFCLLSQVVMMVPYFSHNTKNGSNSLFTYFGNNFTYYPSAYQDIQSEIRPLDQKKKKILHTHTHKTRKINYINTHINTLHFLNILLYFVPYFKLGYSWIIHNQSQPPEQKDNYR